MRKHVNTLSHILFIAGKRFIFEQYSYRSSALAYNTLLAFVPLLFVFFFLMSIFPIFTHAIVMGEDYIYKNFLPTAAASIVSYLQIFMKQAAKLPAISLIFLFITTLLLVDTIEETLNDIWHASYRKGWKKIRALICYWVIFLLIPLILGMGIFITSYLIAFINISSFITSSVLYVIPLIIDIIFLTLVYVFIPHKKVDWADGLLGASIAGILFEAAKILFAYYLIQFPSYSLIYGAFAILPIFLIWLYIFWVIIIFGALISYCTHHHK